MWNRLEHSTREKKAPSEWITSDGNYETFISKEMFDKAQEIDKTSTKSHRTRPTSTYKHWLSGILVCSSCGGRLVRSHTNKSGTCSFQCTAYNHGSCNTSHMISEAKLTPAILDGLKAVLDGGEITYKINHVTHDEHTSEADIIQKKLSRLSFKEERIKEAYRDGIDTLDEYKANKEIISAEREQLIHMLDSIPKSEHGSKKLLLDNIRSAYDIISYASATNEQKSKALQSVVDKIVYDKKNQCISMHFFVNQ